MSTTSTTIAVSLCRPGVGASLDRSLDRAAARACDAFHGGPSEDVAFAELHSRLFGEDCGPSRTMGRYRIEGKLGVGGMGVVFRGYDPILERPVAIKLMRGPREALGPSCSLRKEAQALAQAEHDNVVRVYEVVVEPEATFIVMELVDGVSLADWLDQRPSRSEILRVFSECAMGLMAMHRAGLIHRDFKPDNALLDASGRVRIVDLGLAVPIPRATPSGGPATDVTDVGPSTPRFVEGTPAFMSPEQQAGLPLDARSDQFSFCVALYTALTGVRPFPSHGLERLEAIEARRLAKGVPLPRAVRAALRRGLSLMPDDRFPSMEPLVDAIRRARTATRRRRRWVGGMTVAAGLALGAMWPVAGACDAPALERPQWSARGALETLLAVADGRLAQTDEADRRAHELASAAAACHVGVTERQLALRTAAPRAQGSPAVEHAGVLLDD